LDHLKKVAPDDEKEIAYFESQYNNYFNTGKKIVSQWQIRSSSGSDSSLTDLPRLAIIFGNI